MLKNNYWITLEIHAIENDEPELISQGGFSSYAEVKEYLREQRAIWGDALHYQVRNKPYRQAAYV